MRMRDKIKLLEAQVKELEAKLEAKPRVAGHWQDYPQFFDIDMTIGDQGFEIVVHRVYRVFKARVDLWRKEWYEIRR